MDLSGGSAVVRLGIPRPPLPAAVATDPDAILAWLPRTDADGKALVWTRRDANRLAFVRWLHDTHRLREDR